MYSATKISKHNEGGSFFEKPGTVKQKVYGTSWKGDTMPVYAAQYSAGLKSISWRGIYHFLFTFPDDASNVFNSEHMRMTAGFRSSQRSP